MKIINRRKTVFKGLLLLLLIASLLFYRDAMLEIWTGVKQVTAEELGLSLLLAIFAYTLEGLAIFNMMEAVVKDAKAGEGIFIAYVCEFYRLTTLGNGSGVAEIHYLHKSSTKREDIELGSATVLTMIQYMMKRIAVMALGLTGVLVLYQSDHTRGLCRQYLFFVTGGCLITAIIIAVFLLLSLSEKVAEGAGGVLDWLICKVPSRESNFRKWKEQINLLNQSGKSVLGQKKQMVKVVLIQTGKLLLFYAIPTYLLYGKTTLNISGCLFLMALAYMLSGVIPAPSGAGSLEFVFLLFFTAFTDAKTAAPVILLFRFATWIFPAAVGGLLLGVHRIRST